MINPESKKEVAKLIQEESIQSDLKALLLEAATKNDIVKYIKDRRIINFRYDSPVDPNNEGYYRNIEPFVLGVSKAGNLVLRAWQHNLSSSVTGTQPNWRLFRLDGISEILPVNHKFPSDIKTIKQTRPGYNDKDRDMVKIIASVLPVNPKDLAVKKTVDGNRVKTSVDKKAFLQKQKMAFDKNQKQSIQQKPKAKEKPSAFAAQASKMKIPVKPKKGVDKNWSSNIYKDWVNKQNAKAKNKKKGFSK
jgi:hypothetical protein